MIINHSYVRSINSITNRLRSLGYQSVVIASSPDETGASFKNVGFMTLTDGETITPKDIGIYSQFNLYGKVVKRKDLPKEMRIIHTFEWHWTTWDGETHYGYIDVPKQCYQQEKIIPPLEEITYDADNYCAFSSRIPIVEEDRLKHVINLFLELFGGTCQILDNVRSVIPTRQVPWTLLPQGTYPWRSTQDDQQQNLFTPSQKTRERKFVSDRLKLLDSYNPTSIVTGNSGLRHYVAFIYQEKNFAILESTYTDNATYVFRDNWETVSQLTKAQIINQNLHVARIIHQKNWFDAIHALLTS